MPSQVTSQILGQDFIPAVNGSDMRQLVKELYRHFTAPVYKTMLSTVPLYYGYDCEKLEIAEIAERLELSVPEVLETVAFFTPIMESLSVQKFLRAEITAVKAAGNMAAAVIQHAAGVSQEINITDWREVQKVLGLDTLEETLACTTKLGVKLPDRRQMERPRQHLKDAFGLVGYTPRFNLGQASEVERYVEDGKNIISFNVEPKRLARVALYEYALLEAKRSGREIGKEYAMSLAPVRGFRMVTIKGWEEFYDRYHAKRQAQLAELRNATKVYLDSMGA